jgi:hypothetical protein
MRQVILFEIFDVQFTFLFNEYHRLFGMNENVKKIDFTSITFNAIRILASN